MKHSVKRKIRIKVEKRHWPVVILTLIIMAAIFVVFYLLLKNPAR